MSKYFPVALLLTYALASEKFVSPTAKTHADLDVSKRPVIGIMTEPLRGDLIHGMNNE